MTSLFCTIFKENDILACILYITFSKDDYTYKVSGGSLRPFTGLRKECYFLRSYMAGIRSKKIDLYDWAGISATGNIWLTWKADIYWRAGRRPNEKEKILT